MSALLNVDEVAKQVRPVAPPVPKKISMALINLILDAALFVAIIAVMWVTVLLQVIFPSPTTAGGWRLWGLSFDQWRNVQFFALCAFALLSVEHLALHWNWVCCTIATHVLRRPKPDEASQAVYGVGTFIVVLVLTMGSLVAALFCVVRPEF